MVEERKIADYSHPSIGSSEYDWRKWRLAYRGGHDFLEAYLAPYSKREGNDDFLIRKSISYSPSHAKSAINEIKNSIYQRLVDITREGGSPNYKEAVKGENGGVDRIGSSMNTFMGVKLLPDLLVMKKVGVYVDMVNAEFVTKADEYGKRPYLYMYPVEDIRSWAVDKSSDKGELSTLLLRDCEYEIDSVTGLESALVHTYRLLRKTPEGILVTFFDKDSKIIREQVLNLKRIPFVCFEITESLMADVADYQIGLLNLASSDMSYCTRANFPFYIEQFDPRVDNPYLRPSAKEEFHALQNADPTTSKEVPGEATVAAKSRDLSINVGTQTGRRYPTTVANAPAFIHPSPDPLYASMEKQEKMMDEIRKIVNLAVQSQRSTGNVQSAQSKQMDQSTLEAGLSFIGLVMQNGEQEIAQIWADYEGQKEASKVIYPRIYSLKNEDQINSEAEKLEERAKGIPSLVYKKESAKQIAKMTLGLKVSEKVLETIVKEIEESPNVVSDPKDIEIDVNLGLVSLDTASKARGWGVGEVEKAKKDHADRIARIAAAQSTGLGNAGARGVTDLSTNPGGANQEKQASQDPKNQRDINTQTTRGEGK